MIRRDLALAKRAIEKMIVPCRRRGDPIHGCGGVLRWQRTPTRPGATRCRRRRSNQYFFIGRQRSHPALIDVRIAATRARRLCFLHYAVQPDHGTIAVHQKAARIGHGLGPDEPLFNGGDRSMDAGIGVIVRRSVFVWDRGNGKPGSRRGSHRSPGYAQAFRRPAFYRTALFTCRLVTRRLLRMLR